MPKREDTTISIKVTSREAFRDWKRKRQVAVGRDLTDDEAFVELLRGVGAVR